LSELVLDAIEDFRGQIRQGNNKLNLAHILKNKQEGNTSSATDQKDIFVYADKGRIIQVIYNLLNNAIKFTTEGIISFTVSSKRKNELEEAVLSIKDTGTGIHPDLTRTIFHICNQVR
jgi:signal transduction histidine kinase